MGKASRDKGARGELEFAKLMGGVKIPLSGASGGEFGNDVVLQNDWRIEVKRFAQGEKTLYGWLMDEREKPDAVAFRADRLPWVVALWGPRFKLLIDIQIAADAVISYTEDNMPNPAFYSEYAAAVVELQRLLAMSTRKQMAGTEKEAVQGEAE